MKFETVLVPLDGSALAEAALPMAEEVLRDNPEATLVLMRAAWVTTLPGVDPVSAEVAAVKEAEDYLEEVAGRLRQRGVGRVVTSVWYGSPAASIVEAAEARKADLIIMSTHGRSGLGRLILGSVAESVLRGTRTPILLVRAAGAPVDRPAGASAPAESRGSVRG
jgi:nucleotide-binding universal stress UspA family protein